MNTPFDKRSVFFKEFFGKALSYEAFLDSSEANHKKKWHAFESTVTLTLQQREMLSTFKRSMNVLCLAGSWCGDCARQGPMLKKIAEITPNFNLRFIDNRENPSLADELKIHGAARVPMVLVLSEDFLEVSRFGDRTLAAYRRKAAQELGPACDSGLVPPSGEELAAEMQEWVEYFERNQLLLRLSAYLRSRYND